jgi:molecular chaperone GrpE (heat shock protein)
MDHFAPNARKAMSKYKGTHSQKNMLTMKQVWNEHAFRPRKRQSDVQQLKKELDELKAFKDKYISMEQKMNNLENMMKSKCLVYILG